MLPPQANDVGRWIERSVGPAPQSDHRVQVEKLHQKIRCNNSKVSRACHSWTLRVVSCQDSPLSCLQKHPSLRVRFPNPTQRMNRGFPAATADATRLCLRVSINIIASSASLPSIVRLLVAMGGGGDSLTSTKLCCGGGRPLRWRERGKLSSLVAGFQPLEKTTDLADFSTDEDKTYPDPKMWQCWRGRLASMMPNRSDLVSFGRFPSVGAE